MTLEQRPSDPPVVDPQDFLDRPFERIEIGMLPQNPSIDFLKWLPTLPNETGLVYIAPKWAVVKASAVGIPSWTMPTHADILLHSHPEREEFFMPSPGDMGNCSDTAKNLIVSAGGITQFMAVNGMTPKDAMNLAFDLQLSHPDKDRIYLGYKFLEDIGAKYNFTPWEELDQKSLDTLLYEGIPNV